jgi:hypothetical protein
LVKLKPPVEAPVRPFIHSGLLVVIPAVRCYPGQARREDHAIVLARTHGNIALVGGDNLLDDVQA